MDDRKLSWASFVCDYDEEKGWFSFTVRGFDGPVNASRFFNEPPLREYSGMCKNMNEARGAVRYIAEGLGVDVAGI